MMRERNSSHTAILFSRHGYTRRRIYGRRLSSTWSGGQRGSMATAAPGIPVYK